MVGPRAGVKPEISVDPQAEPMTSKQTRLDVGRQRAAELTTMALTELRVARITAGISQRALAGQLGWPQSRYSEFERGVRPATMRDICVTAALLGLQPSLQLHAQDEPIRDRGHSRLIERFRSRLSPAWQAIHEAPFPNLGDLRSWDLLLMLGDEQRIGVEAETRLRDQQLLVRRIRQRELHGGVDQILVVLSDSAHNRRQASVLRKALGERYGTRQADLLDALANGRSLTGSGLLLM
jgi:transcriptional regulator with XRE-family HTH domain